MSDNSNQVAYFLFSTLPEEPNVGIWYFNREAGQPVRLDVDRVEVFCFLSPTKSARLTASSGSQDQTLLAAVQRGWVSALTSTLKSSMGRSLRTIIPIPVKTGSLFP